MKSHGNMVHIKNNKKENIVLFIMEIIYMNLYMIVVIIKGRIYQKYLNFQIRLHIMFFYQKIINALNFEQEGKKKNFWYLMEKKLKENFLKNLKKNQLKENFHKIWKTKLFFRMIANQRFTRLKFIDIIIINHYIIDLFIN